MAFSLESKLGRSTKVEVEQSSIALLLYLIDASEELMN